MTTNQSGHSPSGLLQKIQNALNGVQQVLPAMRTLDHLEHCVGREGKAPLKAAR